MSVQISQPQIRARDLAGALRQESVTKVRAWEDGRPRSRQRTIGASGIGNPCTRQLAYYATGADQLGQPGDPWPAIVGTSCHEHVLTHAFAADPDWLLGAKVEIAPGINSTLDRFHVPTGTVVDDKVLGKSSLDHLKRHGPGPTYRTQVHVYGFGMLRLGHDVHHVALCCWPRSGFLRDVHVWTEPWNERVVEDALTRWFNLVDLVPALTATPALFDALATADGPCSWCPWFAPAVAEQHSERGCPGHRALTGGAG